jgi:hypothetical protein
MKTQSVCGPNQIEVNSNQVNNNRRNLQGNSQKKKDNSAKKKVKCDCIAGYSKVKGQCINCPKDKIYDNKKGKCTCPNKSFEVNGVCF